MKIKDGFMLRTVADSTVVVPYSEAVDFNGMITLNRTGAFIWKQLQTETTRDELIALLIKEYSIDEPPRPQEPILSSSALARKDFWNNRWRITIRLHLARLFRSQS